MTTSRQPRGLGFFPLAVVAAAVALAAFGHRLAAVTAHKGRAAIRLFTNGQYRSRVGFHFARPRNLFQPDGTTAPERYPVVFDFVREHLPDGSNRRILSFGCSTGEEVFTLHDYFPNATIKGIDINRGSIRICKTRLKNRRDARISFAVGDTASAEMAESYDAIFCMTVLRHGQLHRMPSERCDPLIRFADFEAIVGGLAHCLKPGGFLAIANSNFRFRDTASFADFELVLSAPGIAANRTPIYDRDNRRIDGEEHGELVFRKREAKLFSARTFSD